jgi:hypothetical protein
VIELRFFGRLSVDEAAEILNMSPQSVMREWLTRELRRGPHDAGRDRKA